MSEATQRRSSSAGRQARLDPVNEADFLALQASLNLNLVSPRAAEINVARTYALSPGLLAAQAGLQHYLRNESTIDPKSRELATLRISWRANGEYEFGQHIALGITEAAGLSDSETARACRPLEESEWEPRDYAVLRAVDELSETHALSDSAWAALAREFTPAEIVDLLTLIGRYWTVAIITNAVQVEFETWNPGYPTTTAPSSNGS